MRPYFRARLSVLPGTFFRTSGHVFPYFRARFSKPKYRYQDVQEDQDINQDSIPVERWKSQQCGAHPTGAVEWPPATLSKSNNNSKNKNFLVKGG